jgi:hypothetical protein
VPFRAGLGLRARARVAMAELVSDRSVHFYFASLIDKPSVSSSSRAEAESKISSIARISWPDSAVSSV